MGDKKVTSLDRLRDVMDPPALRQMRKLRDAMNPPALRQMRKLRDAMNPPALRQMRELRDAIEPPALRQMRELHDAMEPPALRRMRELDNAATGRFAREMAEMDRMMKPVYDVLQAQREIDAMLEPMRAMTDSIRSFVEPLGATAQMTQAVADLNRSMHPWNDLRFADTTPVADYIFSTVHILKLTPVLDGVQRAVEELRPWHPVLPNLEEWWRTHRATRTRAPSPWREIYAAEDALTEGNLRKLEEFAVHVLGVDRDALGYVYEALTEDAWRDAKNPLAYLRTCVVLRQQREENRGLTDSRHRERLVLDVTEIEALERAPDAAQARGLALWTPTEPSDALEVKRALTELALPTEDGRAFLRAWLMDTDEGHLKEDGWDNRRINRSKQQLSRGLARLRRKWKT